MSLALCKRGHCVYAGTNGLGMEHVCRGKELRVRVCRCDGMLLALCKRGHCVYAGTNGLDKYTSGEAKNCVRVNAGAMASHCSE